VFCVKLLSQQFDLCMKIGRDFVRLLQDLVCVPEFQSKKDVLDVEPKYVQDWRISDIIEAVLLYDIY
jgi:integrator complex subunit 3